MKKLFLFLIFLFTVLKLDGQVLSKKDIVNEIKTKYLSSFKLSSIEFPIGFYIQDSSLESILVDFPIEMHEVLHENTTLQNLLQREKKYFILILS